MNTPGRTTRILLILLAALAVLAGGIYYAWRTGFVQTAPPEKFLTAVVAHGKFEDTVTANGILQPKEFVDVGTQVSGQVLSLQAGIGDLVQAGQLLAEIDPSVFQARVDGDRAQLLNHWAQLADKKAQLVLADLQLVREQNLARDNATTAEALQSAEALRKSAEAQVNSVGAQIQQTKSGLRGSEASLGYTRIHAPISGTVVAQTAKVGEMLNANQQTPIIMRIADLSIMTVQAQVTETDVTRLRIGMEVYFTTLGGGKRRFHGKLRQISPTPRLDNNVVLYDALFDVENPDQALMTQMTAQVFFVAARVEDALLVPLSALQPAEGQALQNGMAHVGVVDADGNVEQRKVKIGLINSHSVQVIAGLRPDEIVVIGPRRSVAR